MNFWIGVSALQASQFAINNVSHNLANASTEGYHRQEVGFQTAPSQYVRRQFIGTGVEVSGVRRIRDQIIESSYTNSISDLNRVEQQLSIESQIESFFLPGEGSVHNSLTGFFDGLSRLSANPGESALRRSVVSEGVNLAQRIQRVSSGLVDLQQSVGRQLELEVDAVNREINELVEIQNRIRTSPAGQPPNNLLDQRDQLINSLAERIDVQRYELAQNTLGLSVAGSSLGIGVSPIQLETYTKDNGDVAIKLQDGDREIKFTGGKVAALIELKNTTLGEYQAKIDEFAGRLIREVNQSHAVGLGLNGAFTIQRSSLSVDDVAAPLESAGTMFPVEAGEFHLSITSPDDERRTFSVSIDPATESLEDIAAKISGLDNIQAIIDPNTGKFAVIAAVGYKFDFTGELETTPDLSSFSGTATPTISGTYHGDENQRLTVRAVGTGTIGKTPGLKAEVVDGDGNVIKELEIGETYEAGSELELSDGAMVSFAAGDIVAGDSFETRLVAHADTTGFLSATGLNTFFQGDGSSNIAVKTSITENPNEIATSRSGEIGDTRNLEGLVGLRDRLLLRDGQSTFDDFLGEINTEIGFRVQSAISVQVSVSELQSQYQSARDSVSGVDLNEELLNLTKHQKSYEAAVQVVRTIESMFDELFQIIR